MYNPFDIDSCMQYIQANKIPFDASVDILIKQELDITIECAEELARAKENAKIVLRYYKKYYLNNKRKFYRTKSEDKRHQLLKGYKEYLEYKTLLN